MSFTGKDVDEHECQLQAEIAMSRVMEEELEAWREIEAQLLAQKSIGSTATNSTGSSGVAVNGGTEMKFDQVGCPTSAPRPFHVALTRKPRPTAPLCLD